jgi:hypothetical protein
MGGARGPHEILSNRFSGGKPLQRKYGRLGIHERIP